MADRIFYAGAKLPEFRLDAPLMLTMFSLNELLERLLKVVF